MKKAPAVPPRKAKKNPSPSRVPKKAQKSKLNKSKPQEKISKRAAASVDAPGKSSSEARLASICANAKCKLRKAGCYGAEGCPGFRSRA